MAEPITPEFPKPVRLTAGETPVYLKSPLEVDGRQVTELTMKGAATRGKDGVENAVFLMRDSKGPKPMTNIHDLEEIDWEKIDGVQYTMPDGSVHTITKDQLSLTKPEDLQRYHPASQGDTLQEPKLARKILETYSGTPTTLTIVGLKAYETRAHDLADRAMQLKTSLGERIWKQGFGPVFYHEKLHQYYLNMLKASNSPFAEGSIRVAEAAGANRYQELLKNKNFLTRAGTRFVEWAKDNLGIRTLVQKFALEEIGHMKESGEIKERETFDREAASIRKRFEMDVDNQDEYIRKTLGEDVVLLNQPEHKPLVDEIKNMVRRWASGEITTKADFDTATDALFQTRLKGSGAKLFEQAELYTSSLYEVAESLRTRASHEGGLAAIDAQLESMQVRLGMGVMGEATALEPTDVKRGTEMVQSLFTKLEKKGIVGPFLFNEATVSSGVALALSLAVLPKMAVSGFARTAGGFAGGIAAGAIFGGVREYRQLEREYFTHLREREAGMTFSPDAKKRAWMERFFVGQRSADDLIETLTKEAVTDDDVRLKVASLADAKARKALSTRIGLIQFSARENIETQRTALDLSIAQAEKELLAGGKTTKEFLADLTAAQTRVLNEGIGALEGLDDPIKMTLGLLEKYNPEVAMLRRRFPLLGPEVTTGKAQGLEDILKEFRRAARGEAVKKGLVVGATGAAIGLGIRGVAEVGSFLAGGAAVAEVTGPTPPLHEATAVFDSHAFQLSNNLALDGGHLDVVDPASGTVLHDNIADFGNLDFLKSGRLTKESLDYLAERLHAAGFDADTTSELLRAAPAAGTHELVIGSQTLFAPDTLTWVSRGDGSADLVLLAKNDAGDMITETIYARAFFAPGEPADTTPIIEAIKHHPLLQFHEAIAPTPPAPSHELLIPGLPAVTDAGRVAHELHAMIPDGWNLSPVEDLRLEAHGLFRYELLDPSGNVVSDNIQIDSFGAIQNQDALNAEPVLQTLGLHFDSPQQETIEIIGPRNLGEMSMKVADMGPAGEPNYPWAWFHDTMIASSDVDHTIPATNLGKNLFRGFVEHYAPDHNLSDAVVGASLGPDGTIDYTRLVPETTFNHLPVNLFGHDQIIAVGKLMDQAIDKFEGGGMAFADFHPLPPAPGEVPSEDFILKLAYDIGRVGRVPTTQEIQYFMDYLGAGRETVTLAAPTISIMATDGSLAHITFSSEAMARTIITASEITRVGETPEIPLIPIPILWRRPLEPYKPLAPYTPPEVPPGAEPFPLLPRPEGEAPAPFLVVPYGPGAPESRDYPYPYGPKYANEEVLAYYRGRTHPELQKNPGARLNFDTAARWYLEQLTPEYKAALAALDQTIGTPMHDETRIAVCIPVAAHEEKNNVYHTLERYAGQTLEKNQYEILLFLNVPEDHDGNGTLTEVKRFMADHPDMAVRIATGSFPPGTVRFGAYTKYAYDLALLRASKRINPIHKDLLIATADADLEAIDPMYLATAIDQMNSPEGQKLDAMLTLLDFDQRVLDAFPTLKAAVRFGQYVEHQMHESETPYIQTSGAVSVLRGSTLAAVGGVNPNTPAGADIEIGRMIHYARHGKTQGIPKAAYTIGYNGAVGIRTNARRQLVTHLSGQSLIHTWDTFDEGEDVRAKTTPELIAMAKDEHKELNPRDLEREINSYREWDVAMDSPTTRQALLWMGLTEGTDYMIEDGNLRFVGDLAGLKTRIGTLPPQPPSNKKNPGL